MKKLLCIITAVVMSISLFACSSDKTESAAESLSISVETSSESSKVTEEANVKLVKITADSLNVRAEASTDAEIIDAASADQYFLLVKENAADGWHEIKFGDTNGFVYADYVEVSSVTQSEADKLLGNVTTSTESTESVSENSDTSIESSKTESSGVVAENTRRDEDGETR